MSENAQAARAVERARQGADDYRARSGAYVERGGIVIAKDGSWKPLERRNHRRTARR